MIALAVDPGKTSGFALIANGKVVEAGSLHILVDRADRAAASDMQPVAYGFITGWKAHSDVHVIDYAPGKSKLFRGQSDVEITFVTRDLDFMSGVIAIVKLPDGAPQC